MGVQLSHVAPSPVTVGLDSYISELQDVHYDSNLNLSRFLKTVVGYSEEGKIVVKVFVKPSSDVDLGPTFRKLEDDGTKLIGAKNVIYYSRILATWRAGYLVRQYVNSNLYDRLITRPFFNLIEKKWIAFQLLCGLQDCHERGVHHGDIKTENILISSWNSAYLADFSFFKPVYLPDDNPADFSFFFDSSQRRVCYVAPERFLPPDQIPPAGQLTGAMDVFSLGCVLAELFLDGASIFSLSQLLNYRQGSYSPLLDDIEDQWIRELVAGMISLDPSKRKSAQQNLIDMQGKAFPDYFYTFLHQYIGSITETIFQDNEEDIVDNEGDRRIDRVYGDFDKISFFLGFGFQDNDNLAIFSPHTNIFPVVVDIPNCPPFVADNEVLNENKDTCAIIFLSLIFSSMRRCLKPSSKVHACELMLALSLKSSDETKLDRCIPYLLSLLDDDSPIVQVAALRAVIQILNNIESLTPINTFIFEKYILPNMERFVANKEKNIGRIYYAACVGQLSAVSEKFLQLSEATKAASSPFYQDPETEDGQLVGASYQSSYDSNKLLLVQRFKYHAEALLIDNSVAVRRAFLKSVTMLSVFFGQKTANDVILSHLITYLNDKDPMLRASFFHTIVGVASLVGEISVDEYILPVMVQSLADPEESVVENVLYAFIGLGELGLIYSAKRWDILRLTMRFCVHPNNSIRLGAFKFIEICSRWLSLTEQLAILCPIVRPVLTCDVVEFSNDTLVANSVAPLSRPIFNLCIRWALKADRSSFWRGVQNQKATESAFSVSKSAKESSKINTGSKIVFSPEDRSWVIRLREMGLDDNNLWKVSILKEYIWRIATSRTLRSSYSSISYDKPLKIQNFGASPRTVFFLDAPASRNKAHEQARSLIPHAVDLSHVLVDATSSIDEHSSRSVVSKDVYSRISDLTSDLAEQGRLNESRKADGSNPGNSASPNVISNSQHDQPREDENCHSDDRGRNRHTSLEIGTTGIRSSSVEQASPDISMSPEVAYGLMERPEISGEDHTKCTGSQITFSSASFLEDSDHPKSSKEYRPIDSMRAHGYTGRNPHVYKMLRVYDRESLENNHNTDIVSREPTEEGSRSEDAAGDVGLDSSSSLNWKPKCQLVSSFSEHSGGITSIVVSPDDKFFLSSSEDGTIKLWDFERIKKNLIHKPRRTYKHAENVRIECLCFIDQSIFASAANDGSIHLIKVAEGRLKAEAFPRYGKIHKIRQYHLDDGEYVLSMRHTIYSDENILLVTTNRSRILGINLAESTLAFFFTLQNPITYGAVTSLLISDDKSWIVVGTSNGVLSMWDLRFQLRLKSWTLPGFYAINDIKPHPSKISGGRWICVAGGSQYPEITVWDVEKTKCYEVYRSDVLQNFQKDTSEYRPVIIAEDSDELSHEFMKKIGQQKIETMIVQNKITKVYSGLLGSGFASEHEEHPQPFFITTGSDGSIIFWNLTNLSESAVVAGLKPSATVPRFDTVYHTPSLTINCEILEESTDLSEKNQMVPIISKMSRSKVIALQQENMDKNHWDSIQALAFVRRPQSLIITGDASGIIKVYR